MAKKLTKKQGIFVKEYNKTGNATKSAIKAYNVKNYNVARVIWSENLTKPAIIQYFEDNASIAADTVMQIVMNSKNDAVKLNACKDVLDRAWYKPSDKTELTGANGNPLIITRQIDAKRDNWGALPDNTNH